MEIKTHFFYKEHNETKYENQNKKHKYKETNGCIEKPLLKYNSKSCSKADIYPTSRWIIIYILKYSKANY